MVVKIAVIKITKIMKILLFFPIYHFSTFVFRKKIKIKISPLKSLTYFYILVPFTNSSNWSCFLNLELSTHHLYTTWEFQSKVNMKRNTKFRHGTLKSFHRYMKQKKNLYLAKISLMCDFFFFKSAFSKHFANKNM